MIPSDQKYRSTIPSVITAAVFSILFMASVQAGSDKKNDPLLVPNCTAPVINGSGDDSCWKKTEWQKIDHCWIPYGASMPDSADFSGRYKIVWSSSANQLYFLIEIHDDVFVDGFISAVTSDLYNFDAAEVFIDEDASGGLHVFDGKGEDAKTWGTNAENAFTHHIYAQFPPEGSITTKFIDNDLGGTNWNNTVILNHSPHLPKFALQKNGSTAVWEFSMKVFNDSYAEKNPEASRVKLRANKVMGISVAYCDNDDPHEYPKVRDAMFGSVPEPSPGNLHWKDASYFGRIQLIGERPLR